MKHPQLQRLAELQQEVLQLSAQIAQNKKIVLGQILEYVNEYEITFGDLRTLFVEHHLPLSKVKPKEQYRYYDPQTQLVWDGYGRRPNWFMIRRANEYLNVGFEHTPLIRRRLAILKKQDH